MVENQSSKLPVVLICSAALIPDSGPTLRRWEW
jgi:hypothetical protein